MSALGTQSPASAQRARFPFGSGHRVALAVASLLAVHYLLAVSAAFQKSLTFDEHMHLAQGCLRWLQPGCKFPAMNGVVAQRLAALPSVLAGVKAPDMQTEPWSGRDQFYQARTIFYESGNDFRAMLNRGRAAVALLGVACGFLTFLWARELFGTPGGLLSLTLYAFSPMTLANGPLVTADMAAALFFLAATHAFWKATHRATLGTVAVSCAALALLVLSKTSGVLIVPVFALIAVVRIAAGPELAVTVPAGRRLGLSSVGGRSLGLLALLALHAAVLIPVLWMAYNFRTLGPELRPITEQFLRSPEFSFASATGMKAWLVETIAGTGLLPDAFAEGLRMTLLATEQTPAFMAGRYSMEGFAWFFPFAFLVKTPVGVLVLGCSGLIAALGARGSLASGARSPGLYDVTPLFALLVIYGAAAVTSKMNIGIRHILPMYAPLLILAGFNARWLTAGPAWARWGVLALVAGTVVSGVASYPHYLAYFNLPSGGSARGYRLLADSSIDWGQDLPALKKWLDRHRRGDEPVYLSYFGTGLPESYGIEPKWLPGHFDWSPQELPPLRGGLYCISATMLNSVYSQVFGPWSVPFENLYQQVRAAVAPMEAAAGDPLERARSMEREDREFWEQRLTLYRQLRFSRLCAALRQRTPDAHAGHSILIFRLTDEEAAQTLAGPPAELQPTSAPTGRTR